MANRLKRFRRKHKLSQSQYAAILEISKDHLGQLERRKMYPSRATLVKIEVQEIKFRTFADKVFLH